MSAVQGNQFPGGSLSDLRENRTLTALKNHEFDHFLSIEKLNADVQKSPGGFAQ
jgi:hypothetical protein